jgi:cholesterol transport system auxiliary component
MTKRERMLVKTPALVVAGLTLAACSLTPAPRAPVSYHDLGPVHASVDARPVAALIVVHDATGPLWLDSENMHFRLNYEDPSRVRSYANSHWVASPLQMISERLRVALAERTVHGGALPDVGVPGDYWIRVTVEEFCQVFDGPAESRGVVRLRVMLVKARGHVLVEQRAFLAEVPAPAPDSAGGVTALTRALDQAIAAVGAWVSDAVAHAEPAKEP